MPSFVLLNQNTTAVSTGLLWNSQGLVMVGKEEFLEPIPEEILDITLVGCIPMPPLTIVSSTSRG